MRMKEGKMAPLGGGGGLWRREIGNWKHIVVETETEIE